MRKYQGGTGTNAQKTIIKPEDVKENKKQNNGTEQKDEESQGGRNMQKRRYNDTTPTEKNKEQK